MGFWIIKGVYCNQPCNYPFFLIFWIRLPWSLLFVFKLMWAISLLIFCYRSLLLILCMSLCFRWVPIRNNDWYWIRHHIKLGMPVIVEILVSIITLSTVDFWYWYWLWICACFYALFLFFIFFYFCFSGGGEVFWQS